MIQILFASLYMHNAFFFSFSRRFGQVAWRLNNNKNMRLKHVGKTWNGINTTKPIRNAKLAMAKWITNSHYTNESSWKAAERGMYKNTTTTATTMKYDECFSFWDAYVCLCMCVSASVFWARSFYKLSYSHVIYANITIFLFSYFVCFFWSISFAMSWAFFVFRVKEVR